MKCSGKDRERIAEHQVIAVARDAALGGGQVLGAQEAFPLLDRSGIHLGHGGGHPARVELHLDLEPVELKHPGPDGAEGVVAVAQQLPDSLLLLQQRVGFACRVVPGNERRQLGLRDGDLV